MSPEFQPFAEVGQAGFYLAIDIDFLRPLREVSTIPDGWIEEYVQSGFMTLDPVLHWAVLNTGMCRWSSLQDPHGILWRAGAHGLRFGAAFSTSSREGRRRSFAFVARADRNILDRELERCFVALQDLHDEQPTAKLTAAEIEVLNALHKGGRIKKIAVDLGVTDGAIKQRLRNARDKLGAQTATQATAMAQELGLI